MVLHDFAPFRRELLVCYVWCTVEPLLTATSLQRQRPLQRVSNYQNDLSTTASLSATDQKLSGMVAKVDPYGALMINRGNRI